MKNVFEIRSYKCHLQKSARSQQQDYLYYKLFIDFIFLFYYFRNYDAIKKRLILIKITWDAATDQLDEATLYNATAQSSYNGALFAIINAQNVIGRRWKMK